MKRYSFIIAVICLLIPSILTAQSQSEFKPRKTFGLKVEDGSLFPLKSPETKANIYFDYTECIVNDKTSLYGVDAAGDEITATIINELKDAENSFFKTFEQNYNNEHCQLIPEDNNSPYRIEIKIYKLKRWEQKVLLSKSRFTQMFGLIFVIDNKTSTKIATCNFCAGGGNKGLKDPEYDYLTKLMYANLASDFAKQIKKAKTPKN